MANFAKLTNIKTAGTTFEGRQGKLINARTQIQKGSDFTVMLRREPRNERDCHAIAVLLKTGDSVAKIGYVPANTAFWLSQKMDAGKTVRACNPTMVGGSGRATNIGVHFDIVHELDDMQTAAPAAAVM